MKQINHNELKKAIERAYERKVPLFVWGTMGIGKSSVIREFAKENKLDFVDVRISQLEPSDLRGLPTTVNGEVTKWLPPSWLPKSNSDSKGILFFDEINLAPPSIMASTMQLVLDRRLGDYTLPDGWVIISAGNRIEDKGNVFEMSMPLCNRFSHLELGIPSVENWSAWAVNRGIDGRIVSFLNFKPSRLFSFDNKAKDKAFATPRSWEFCSRLIEGLDANDSTDTLVASCVGEGTAIELGAFLKLTQKINAKDLLDNPKKIKKIEEIDLKYCLVGSVAEYFKAHKDAETLEKVFGVVKELEAEFGVLLIRLARGMDRVSFDKFAFKSPIFRDDLAKNLAKYCLD